MELRPGYKHTDLGMIPEDWEVLPASQIGRFRGGTGFPLTYQGQQEGAFPFYKVSDMNNIGNEKFMNAAKNWISEEARRNLGAHIFPAGSIVFAKVGAAVFLERKKILSRPSCLDNNMAALVLDVERSIALFIHAQLLGRKLGDLVATTALPSLSGKVLGAMVMARPSLPEQSAIATVLSEVDALLAAQDALIAKHRAIKQGAMQELLTGKRRMPGFDGEWTNQRLGSAATLKARIGWQGLTTAEYLDSGDYYLVTGTDFKDGRIDWENCPHVAKSRYDQDANIQIVPRDILVTKDGTIGKVALVEMLDKPATLNSGVFVIRPKKNSFVPEFFFHLMLSKVFEDFLAQLSAGSTINHLYQKDFIGFEYRVPPTKEEQTAIAEILSDMDSGIALLEAKRKKTLMLKQGMMQELLTGRIRLVTHTTQGLGASSNVIPFKTKSRKPQEEASSTQENSEGRKANVHFLRSVLAAEIVDQLHNESTFGHVKFAKLIFLAEHLCNVDTGSNYHRDAAGPYDSRALRSIDSQLKKLKWFDAHKLGERYLYLPMEKHGGHKEYFDRYYASIRTKLDDIIATFRTAKTQQCEIVATLYGAWDELINSDKSATDEAILDQVLNHWHDKKREIAEDRWRKALEWMREKGYTPEGAS